jgi:hypothetical protein
MMPAPHPVEWWDACARAEALRDAYFNLLSGQLASEVEFLANGVTRRVRYSQTDLARLETEWRAAAGECEGTTGRRIHTVRLSTSKGV